MSELPLGKSPGTCRITVTIQDPNVPAGHKGASTEKVLAEGAWLWLRPLSSASQDARFARLRTVVTHQINVDESIPMVLGAVVHYQGRTYPVKGLTPPGPAILLPNQGWLLDVEEVLPGA